MKYAPIKARNASRVSHIVREGAIMGEVQEVQLRPSNDVEFPILLKFYLQCVVYQSRLAAGWGRGSGVEALS
jgi:hypothetical protein